MKFRSFISLLLLVPFALFAQPDKNAPTYKTGWFATRKLGDDLYKSLKPKFREQIHVQPISLETDVMPFVKPVEYPDENKPLRVLFISVGFIDLMNNVAHAKAIDKIEKGYFAKYIQSLSEESGEMSLKELPNLSEKKYWTDDMMNEQLSNFNQMVGMVIAVELTHHYLGHFKKYGEKLADEKGKPVAINTLLTPEEFVTSIKTGAMNSLECGLGFDGVKALYDSIDKMPKRPSWTAYFLPDGVKLPKMKKDLEKLERDYFNGKN